MHEMDRMVGKGSSIHAVSQDKQSIRHTKKKQAKALLKSGGTCDNCIFSHSGKDQCPAKEMACFFCQKKGHMIAKCRKRL